ncbi:hypothetical protein ACP70R_024790 [Stipagrostis hirtigluma subsp. patula]
MAASAPPPPPLRLAALSLAVLCLARAALGDTNGVFEPCSDARIQRGDGFSFGIAFAGYSAFFSGPTQLSPCDRRLNLASSAQLAVFRPKVDEISLLTINTTTGFNPASAGGFMVAFAGRKYAARSVPIFVSNSSFTVSSFTLFSNSIKADFKTCIGRRMAVVLAQVSQIRTLFASGNKLAPLEHKAARPKDQSTAALASNWLSRAPTSTNQF